MSLTPLTCPWYFTTVTKNLLHPQPTLHAPQSMSGNAITMQSFSLQNCKEPLSWKLGGSHSVCDFLCSCWMTQTYEVFAVRCQMQLKKRLIVTHRNLQALKKCMENVIVKYNMVFKDRLFVYLSVMFHKLQFKGLFWRYMNSWPMVTMVIPMHVT